MSKQEYPKWLYHSSKPATEVPDAASHADLGPGWVESPADLPQALPAAASDTNEDPDKPAAVAPSDPPVAPAADSEAAPSEADEAAAFYKAKAAAVIARLAGCSKETLERALRFEQANPKGPRVSVVKAIEKQLAG